MDFILFQPHNGPLYDALQRSLPTLQQVKIGLLANGCCTSVCSLLSCFILQRAYCEHNGRVVVLSIDFAKGAIYLIMNVYVGFNASLMIFPDSLMRMRTPLDSVQDRRLAANVSIQAKLGEKIG